MCTTPAGGRRMHARHGTAWRPWARGCEYRVRVDQERVERRQGPRHSLDFPESVVKVTDGI